MLARATGVGQVPWWRLMAALLVAGLLAASWILLSLLAGKSGLGQALTAQNVGQAALGQAVTRTGVTPKGTKVQVLFATREYYERIGQYEALAEADPLKHLVFIVTEENHEALKPAPLPTLLADGQKVNAPVKDRLLSSSEHHRTRMIRFVRAGLNGDGYVPEGTRRLELSWPDVQPTHRADHSLANPLSWDWPVKLPSEAVTAGMTPGGFLLLTAGLFAALSPCLIQLTLYYLSNLAGVSAEAGAAGGASGAGAASGFRPAAARRKVLMTALMFTAGISLAYTLGGVLAGYLGRAVQVSNVLGEYGRWIAVGAGVFIIMMGVRTVAQSNVPMVCHLPGANKMSRWKTGPAAPFLSGFLMSLGCLQCFGGALFASLLVYVGSLGSPGLGALMLFLFSLGVAVPFLAAALAWERIAPWVMGAGRTMQYVGLVSGVLMITFGLLMAIDRFHWISGLMLKWMPFLQA